MNPHPIIIDTDAGVDDALALIFALRSPELSIRAITTVAGNSTVANCTRNVRRVLGVLNAPGGITVSRGASRPLRRSLVTAPEVHGRDGLGDIRPKVPSASVPVGRDAVKTILTLCNRYGKSLIIIALGPLTNLALAWKRNPSVLRKVGRIISMGGAFRVPGNTGPVSEFNYYVDPDAAKFILTSGLPVMVLPLDLTEEMILTRKEVRKRAARHPGPVSRFVEKVTRSYMQYHVVTEGFAGGYLHDPVAVAAAIDPHLFQWSRVTVQVETKGDLTRGMTIMDVSKAGKVHQGGIQVAFRMNKTRFMRLYRQRTWKRE